MAGTAPEKWGALSAAELYLAGGTLCACWHMQRALVATRCVAWWPCGVHEPPWDRHAHASLPGTQGTAAGLRSAGRTWAPGSCGICYLGIAAIAWGKLPARWAQT